MTNNITTLVYTYTKCRLKMPPEILYKLAHTVPVKFMDSFKVTMESSTMREGPIPTTTPPP